LLDAGESELVQRDEPVGIGQRVRRVGVHLQHHVRTDEIPHRCDDLDVPAGTDLQFDPLVALIEPLLHLGQRVVELGDPQAFAGGRGARRTS
jgi:hypothetical protein